MIAGLDSDVRGIGNLIGGHELSVHEARSLHLGAFLKSGFSGAGTEGADGEVRGPIFFGEGFRKTEDVSFARIVGGHERAGEKSGGAGDVDETRVGELEKKGDESLTEVGEDADIEVEQAELSVEGDLVKRAVVCKSGIVDELVDGSFGGGDLVVKFGSCSGGSEVEGDGCDGDFVSLFEAGTDVLEGVLGAGNEDKGVSVFGIHFGEGQSDSAGCAGDEGGGFAHVD